VIILAPQDPEGNKANRMQAPMVIAKSP